MSMYDLQIKETKYKIDSGYTGRTSKRELDVSSTRNNGTIDIVATEYRQYNSGKFTTQSQFHNYNRADIEKLRDYLTAQLEDRKYW